MKRETGKLTYSWTDISGYQTCQLRWYYERALRLKLKAFLAPSTQALDWGKAFHELQRLRNCGEDLDTALNIILPQLQEDPSGLRSPGRLEAYSRAFERFRDPSLEILVSETPLVWNMDECNGTTLALCTVIDAIARDSRGEHWVVELKTSAMSPYMLFQNASVNWQFRIEALGASLLLGTPVTGLLLQHVHILKTAGSTSKPWEECITQNQVWVGNPTTLFDPLKEILREMTFKLESGRRELFAPNTAWGCGAWWQQCVYYPMCERGGYYNAEEWDSMYQEEPYTNPHQFKELEGNFTA